MQSLFEEYYQDFSEDEIQIAKTLINLVETHLLATERKIWHAHPMWFMDENPIVGLSKQKKGIRLMFWSGADFEEAKLSVKGKKFKDASIFYNQAEEINEEDLKRWLQKSMAIQWDYKNLIKRKGQLERLK